MTDSYLILLRTISSYRIFGVYLSSFQPVFSVFCAVEKLPRVRLETNYMLWQTDNPGRCKVFLALSAVLNLGVKMIPGPVKMPMLVSYFSRLSHPRRASRMQENFFLLK